ncbi:MAG: BsuPI-related putative proteinase inhibitor [Gemmatimonadaceae bacterium]
MTNRFIIPLLCAASVAFARGTTGHRETLATSTNDSKAEITSTFSVHANSRVEFQLGVRNNTTRMLELRFPNGRTHEFIVQDESGREVWRWSKSRMFTQGLQNKLLKSHEVTTFTEEWDADERKGKFTAIAILPSDNHPIEERVEFELK